VVYLSCAMKVIEPRPSGNTHGATRKLLQLANAVGPIQDGGNYIEKINGLFPLGAEGPAKPSTRPGWIVRIAKCWLWPHEECGTFH